MPKGISKNYVRCCTTEAKIHAKKPAALISAVKVAKHSTIGVLVAVRCRSLLPHALTINYVAEGSKQQVKVTDKQKTYYSKFRSVERSPGGLRTRARVR